MAISKQSKAALRVAVAVPQVADELVAAVDAATGGSDPLGLASLGNALLAKTGTGTAAARTITGTANQITVTNGSGVSGNPTISLPVTIDITTSYKVGGTKVVGAQGAAVIDATDDASAITQLNALLARLRTHGLIAT